MESDLKSPCSLKNKLLGYPDGWDMLQVISGTTPPDSIDQIQPIGLDFSYRKAVARNIPNHMALSKRPSCGGVACIVVYEEGVKRHSDGPAIVNLPQC